MKIISTIFLFGWVLACHFMKYSSRGSSGNKHRHFPPESALMPTHREGISFFYPWPHEKEKGGQISV